jgi:hypothetical protein
MAGDATKGHGRGSRVARHLEQRAKDRVRPVVPFRALVSSITNGKIFVVEAGDDEEPFLQDVKQIAAARLTVSDEVLVIPSNNGRDYTAIPIESSPLTDSIFVGESVTSGSSSSAATVSSTTDLVNDQIALAWSEAVPNGTYDVTVFGTIIANHSASNQAHIGVNIEGDTDVGHNFSIASTSPPATSMTRSRTRTGVVVADNTLTVNLVYRANVAGTVSARNPSMIITYRRTA